MYIFFFSLYLFSLPTEHKGKGYGLQGTAIRITFKKRGGGKGGNRKDAWPPHTILF